MAAPTGEVAPIIANVLAPAVMVSYCGLLILGLQNRYSTVVNRLRALNHERFELARMPEMPVYEAERFSIISVQIKRFVKRCRMIRNAITCIFSGVIFFLLSATLSLVDALRNIDLADWIILTFSLGLIATIASMILATIDIYNSFRIVAIEAQAETHSGLAKLMQSIFHHESK